MIVLVRHGETEWSRTGRHTGRTDIPLTDEGRAEAAQLRPALAKYSFAAVFVSPLLRARHTAELAGLTDSASAVVTVDPDLVEWDYGSAEGRTTAELPRHRPALERLRRRLPRRRDARPRGRARRPGHRPLPRGRR